MSPHYSLACTRIFAAAILGFSIPVSPAAPPRYDHVVVVVEENRTAGQIIGDTVNCPYINQLAQGGVTLSSMWGITHPSQPNYLHLFSGSAQGVIDDNLIVGYPFTAANLGAELIAAGFTFRGYSEFLNAVGDANYDPHTATDPPGTKYRRKHNPWANWQGAGTNQIPPVTNNIFSNFPADFTQLPSVSIIVPDQNHDMHDGSRKMADDWLLANLSAYANWAPSHNSLLIITWDEDDYNEVNKIATVFHGANLKYGRAGAPTVTLHNLLRTLEDMYGATHASRAAQCRSISGIFEGEPTPRLATFRQGLNSYTGAADTFITGEITTTNAAIHDLSVDGDYGAATGLQPSQALVRFNNLFGNLAGQIPASATILSAKLFLQTGPTAGNETADRVALHRMNISWSDADTWNSLGTGIATDGTDAVSAVTFSLYPAVIDIPQIFDVTADVTAWKSGTANYGWVVAPDTSGGTDGWVFKSSETASDPTIRPMLEVAYLLPNTPFGYWTEDMALAGASADPLADPERDGIVNVLEYAFRNDPLAQDPPLTAGSGIEGLPIVRRVNGGGGPRLEMEYVRRKAASGSGITYTAEFGSAVGTWLPAGPPTLVVSLDANWERVIVQDAAGIGLPARFGHVRVTLP